MKVPTPSMRSGAVSWMALPLLALFIMSCSEDSPVDQTSSKNASEYGAAVPTAWSNLQLELVQKTPGFSPPVAARAFGYTGVALYQSVLPGMPNYNSLEGQLNGLNDGAVPDPEQGQEYHWPTVANAALAQITTQLFANATDEMKAKITALEAQYANPTEVDAAVVTRSAAYGKAVADAVFEWSKTDGGHEGYSRNFPTSYTPPTGAGMWVPTPRKGGAAPQSALQPFWGTNRPFVLTPGNPNDLSDPGAPPAYSTDPSSQMYLEAKEVYDVVQGLTDDQEAIAAFWSDDPGTTCTPPGHSMSILTQCLDLEDKTLDFAAVGYAQVGFAVSDAFLACWESKFRYNLLRPITYIINEIDPAFTADDLPLSTPPFPEYTSGHSVQSGAAAEVLTSLMGNNFAFTDHTHDARPLPSRQFASFYAAADEAAISRLYGGIHYRAAIERGVEQGKKVAQQVLTKVDWMK